MSNLKQILIGAGITGGLIAGITWLLRLKHTGAELETQTSVKVHKIDLAGITLRVDATLKNPTRTELNIKFPFVRIYYRDTVLGSSQVVDKDIAVPAFGEARIDSIMIQLPLSRMLSLGADLISSLQQGGSVKLNVKVTTTIDLGIKQLPFETIEEVTLKQ